MLNKQQSGIFAALLFAVALNTTGAQNYSECQAPDAHMNPKCNGSAPATPTVSVGGTYTVQGTSPEGGKYEGTVTITGDSQSGYQFNWTIGAEQYSGTGKLEGNTLTVDWGAAEPVVYKVSEGGSKLIGKWGKKGRGKEKLTRQ